MLRLNKLTDYAIVLLSQMACKPGQRFSTPALAQGTGISEPTVAKILKDLVKTGLVVSSRGAQGGYTICCDSQNITVRQVIEAIEGPIALTECIETVNACCPTTNCGLRGNWEKVNSAVRRALDDVTLIDMMRPNIVQIQERA